LDLRVESEDLARIGVANAARFDLHTVKGGINYRF
jgi:hypothetical protein